VNPRSARGPSRALFPAQATSLRGVAVRGRVRELVPDPLGGGGLDDRWMHGVLLDPRA
jgi:hypothetical protein